MSFWSFLFRSPKPSKTEYEFQQIHSFEERKRMSAGLLQKNSNLCPIILEKSDQCELLNLPKNQMLIKRELTIGQLLYLVREKLKLTSQDSLFLFVDNEKVPSIHQTVGKVYDTSKHKDGFLYITYGNDNSSN